MSAKQSGKLGRRNILETEDGTLVIAFPDDGKAILVRFIIELGRRTLQTATIQDVSEPLKNAKIA